MASVHCLSLIFHKIGSSTLWSAWSALSHPVDTFPQVIVLSAGSAVHEYVYWQYVHNVMHNLEVNSCFIFKSWTVFFEQGTLKDLLGLPGSVAQWVGGRSYPDDEADAILQRPSVPLATLRQTLLSSARVQGGAVEGSMCAKQRMAHAVNAMRTAPRPVPAAAAVEQ